MKQNPGTLQWSGEYDAIGQKIPEIKSLKKEWRLHKYIGFYNTDEVCHAEGGNKEEAKKLCEDMLLKYFHELQPTVTPMPLKFYNGEVAYVGSTVVKD